MLVRGVISCRSLYGAVESLVILGIVFFFCSYSAYAQAGQVVLAWDANTESILGGYQLYYGQASGNYTANVDVGIKTSYTLGNLQEGKTYYFAVKAYAIGKLIWSGFSNEVSKTVPTSSTALTSSTSPIASFNANPTSGAAPLTVTFTDSSTGTISTRSWDFGDGSTGSGTTAVKTYSNPGTYTVRLTVSGPVGSATKTQSISATAAAPVVTEGVGTGGSATGLVAAYNFEEASGATVVDASGKANHGTLSGAARITQGKFGNALFFDGVNDWVTVNDAASLDLTAGMTLEAWVYPTQNMSGYDTVLTKERPTGPTGIVYSLLANGAMNQPATNIVVTTNQYGYVQGGPWLLANAWTHLAATYDGTTERLYVNGTQVASRPQSGNIAVSNGVLRIGGNSIWPQFFQGRIDEVRVYNRALSAAEIGTDRNTSVASSSAPVSLIGTNTVGPISDSLPAKQAYAFQNIAATTGKVTRLSVYVDAGSAATNLVVGLYSNWNGHPYQLLGQGTLTNPTAGQWNNLVLPAVSVTSGTPYWIAILSANTGTLRFRDAAAVTAQPSETSSQTTLTTLPSTWSTGTLYNEGPLSASGAGYP